MKHQIACLAEIAVRGRTHIHRNGYSRDIEYEPEPEAATRLAQQLAQLAKGSAVIGERATVEAEDYELVKRVAFDCVPTLRRKLLFSAIRGEKFTGPPYSTISYAREDLTELGLLTCEDLSEQAQELLSQAGVFCPSQKVPSTRANGFPSTSQRRDMS